MVFFFVKIIKSKLFQGFCKNKKTILLQKNQIIMKRVIIYSLATCFILGCTSVKKSTDNNEIDKLVNLMTGTFNSAKQATEDTAFYDITLQMYPIWLNKKGENWLYVEQALSSAPQRPYRQRIYKVERVSKDLYQSTVYTLPQPKRFIGKWSNPAAFDIISPDSLVERNGCSVFLRKIAPNYFRGATKDGTCESSMSGANYATSEVEIFENKILSWDRGFDKKAKQVWGAVKGGYVFERVK